MVTMMKKEYSKPDMRVFRIAPVQLLDGSPGTEVYTDDPQPPGNALAPFLDSSSDDEEDDEKW